MQRDTIFRIALMTKAVTAACVMMLIEDGKIELDAPANRDEWLLLDVLQAAATCVKC